MIRLQRTAIATLIVHLLAGAAMALVLRHGLETNPDIQERLRFIAGNRVLWTGS